MAVTALAALGPAAMPALVRLLVRNLPLLVAALVVAYLLLWNAKPTPADQSANMAE